MQVTIRPEAPQPSGSVISNHIQSRSPALVFCVTRGQWTGGVYSQGSGETYYGTMSMKGINTLRVEACAVGRFYCSGNNWSRITRRADSLATSRQTSRRAALVALD